MRNTWSWSDTRPTPPLSMLARPILRASPACGLTPALGARQRTRRFSSLSVLRISTMAGSGRLAFQGRCAGACPGLGTGWACASSRSMVECEADGVGCGWPTRAPRRGPGAVPGLRVVDVLSSEPPSTGATMAGRGTAAALAFGAVERQPPRPAGWPAPTARIEPRIDQSVGKKSQDGDLLQDLLRTATDEDTFEALATTVPLRVDPATGASEQLGPPAFTSTSRRLP